MFNLHDIAAAAASVFVRKEKPLSQSEAHWQECVHNLAHSDRLKFISVVNSALVDTPHLLSPQMLIGLVDVMIDGRASEKQRSYASDGLVACVKEAPHAVNSELLFYLLKVGVTLDPENKNNTALIKNIEQALISSPHHELVTVTPEAIEFLSQRIDANRDVKERFALIILPRTLDDLNVDQFKRVVKVACTVDSPMFSVELSVILSAAEETEDRAKEGKRIIADTAHAHFSGLSVVDISNGGLKNAASFITNFPFIASHDLKQLFMNYSKDSALGVDANRHAFEALGSIFEADDEYVSYGAVPHFEELATLQDNHDDIRIGAIAALRGIAKSYPRQYRSELIFKDNDLTGYEIAKKVTSRDAEQALGVIVGIAQTERANVPVWDSAIKSIAVTCTARNANSDKAYLMLVDLTDNEPEGPCRDNMRELTNLASGRAEKYVPYPR